jgi:chromosome segregation ATPase
VADEQERLRQEIEDRQLEVSRLLFDREELKARIASLSRLLATNERTLELYSTDLHRLQRQFYGKPAAAPQGGTKDA